MHGCHGCWIFGEAMRHQGIRSKIYEPCNRHIPWFMSRYQFCDLSYTQKPVHSITQAYGWLCFSLFYFEALNGCICFICPFVSGLLHWHSPLTIRILQRTIRVHVSWNVLSILLTYDWNLDYKFSFRFVRISSYVLCIWSLITEK